MSMQEEGADPSVWAYSASRAGQAGSTLASRLGTPVAPPEAPAESEAPAEDQGAESLETLRARKAQLDQRMAELRATAEAQVLSTWTSPWKGADAVKAKVDTRLASNHEFRTVMAEARDLDARLSEIDPEYVDPNQSQGRQSGGHPAIGRQ